MDLSTAYRYNQNMMEYYTCKWINDPDAMQSHRSNEFCKEKKKKWEILFAVLWINLNENSIISSKFMIYFNDKEHFWRKK